jgi:hypothetical protein
VHFASVAAGLKNGEGLVPPSSSAVHLEAGCKKMPTTFSDPSKGEMSCQLSEDPNKPLIEGFL